MSPQQLLLLMSDVQRQQHLVATSRWPGVNRFADRGDSDPEKIIRLAQASPAAQNGLLHWEHVAYQMAWKEQVNPHSEPIVVLYGGMGPDISTVLLATDPTVIVGIDLRGIYINKLRDTLADWDKFDKKFRASLTNRRRTGYWSSAVPFAEGPLLAEFKALGVERTSIRIFPYRDIGIAIAFDWAYPGQRPTRRYLIYVQSNIEKFFAKEPSDFPWGQVDVYYQKSVTFDWTSSEYFYKLPRFLQEQGWILVGVSHSIDALDREKRALTSFTSSNHPFAFRNVARLFVDALAEKPEDGNNGWFGDEYSWRLYGLKRR